MLKRRFLWLSLGLAMAPVLFIWQGLDFTDMGYHLVSSRDMLIEPASNPGYTAFLSMFLNALWLKVSAPWGLVGAKFGAVLVYWGIFASSYVILKDFMTSAQVLTSLLITFIYTQWTWWISYNEVTSLFACLTLSSLYLGFKLDKKRLYLFSGALCALSFFARLPNIMMAGFGFLPFLTEIMMGTDFFNEKIWKRTGLFFIGYGGMFVLFIIFLKYAGYLEHYIHSIIELAKLSSNASYHHSTNLLLNTLISDYKRILAIGFVFILIGSSLSFFLKRNKCFPLFIYPALAVFAFYMGWTYFRTYYRIHRLFLWLAFFCLLYQIWLLLTHRHSVSRFLSPGKYKKNSILISFIALILFLISADYLHGRIANLYDPVFGIVLILLLISLFKTWRIKGKNAILAHLAAIAMFLTVPLGSNNGIRNAVFGLWLSVPIALQFLESDKKIGVNHSFFSFQSLNRSSLIKGLAIVLLLSAGSAIALRYSYRDSANRLEMRFSVDHPKLKGVLTSQERALVVQGVLDELNKYVKPGDYLLGYHTVSTLYFLTETLPYLYNAWPFLYEPHQLRYYLEKAEKERPANPVVVRSKYSLQNFEWPKSKFTNRSARYTENLKIMADYLQDKKYQKVWESEIFEILCVK